MKILDLFSGLEGWSQPFRERGHEVVRVENDPQFPAEHRDIMTFDPLAYPPFDGILASPPCQSFSLMAIGKNWTHDNQPKSERAWIGRDLVLRTIWIIKRERERNPGLWFIVENPVAKLRKMRWLDIFERRAITQCQYGKRVMKPTDLWGGFPTLLVLRPPCKNGAPCHVAAPRGSRTGTQGMCKHESAKIPRELALDVCLAAERIPVYAPVPRGGK